MLFRSGYVSYRQVISHRETHKSSKSLKIVSTSMRAALCMRQSSFPPVTSETCFAASCGWSDSQSANQDMVLHGPDRYLQGFIVDYVRLKDMHIVQTLRGSRQMGSFASVPHNCEHCALGSCCLYEDGLSDTDATSWLDSDCEPTHQLADVLEADAPRGSDDSI